MARTPPRTHDELSTGDTFAARLPDGRYGACRVVRAWTDEGHGRHHHALVGALAWLGTAPPPLSEPRLRLLLRKTANDSDGEPLLFWSREAQLPETLTYLGALPRSESEVLGRAVGHCGWKSFADQVLAQWRYEEQQGLSPANSDAELRRRAREAARRYAAARRRQALASLTGKGPFSTQEDGSEPEEDAPAYRQVLADTLATLQALGPDGDEVAKLDALRLCVERFNALEENIDTVVRETICDYFDDLVWVAGLEDYGEDLNCPWRDF
jgi:hypothetical protein